MVSSEGKQRPSPMLEGWRSQYEAVFPASSPAVVRRGEEGGDLSNELTGTQNGSLQNLAFDAAGVVWEATEAADTRCWGLLPDKIQVLRVELPAGEHELDLRPIGRHDRLSARS